MQNLNRIIQKCVDELDSPTPRLDYIRGMLETILSFSDETPTSIPPTVKLNTLASKAPYTPHLEGTVMDEAGTLDAIAKANLERVKAANKE